MASATKQTTQQTDSHPEGGEIQRDEQYWYSTGDIVLVANRQVAFKVYVGLLIKESAVFRYLVDKDVPQPENQESIDNCPVIHLTDDPQDLRTFLAFIYDGWRRRDDYKKWSVVRVMLLLGDKYDTPEIYEEGVDLLRRTFPKDFPAWDAPKPMAYAPEDVMLIANVTRNMDPDIYAVALYLCCSLPITTLISGLAPDVLHRCLRGREELPVIRFNALRHLCEFRPSDSSCRPPGCLSFSRTNAPAEYARMYLSRQPMTSYDVLQTSTWTDLIAVLKQKGLCQNCEVACRGRARVIRQKIRNKLVEVFREDNPGKTSMFD